MPLCRSFGRGLWEILSDLARGRIARVLVDTADEGGGPLIEKALTHQTIAHVIGASRETVSRAMREFQDSGWISTERRRIRITNRAALVKRSQQRG